MKMLELQAGLGFGVKKFRVVFVFDNEKVFNEFVNSGWQLGGQSTAAAKTAGRGTAMAGAASVSDGVWMYQLTDKGLAAEITAKATKDYEDEDLNFGLLYELAIVVARMGKQRYRPAWLPR